MNGEWDIMSFSSTGVMWLLWGGMLLALIRLIRGPSLADRVVALDLIAIMMVGVMVIHSIATQQAVFIRAAIVVGLVAYLGTVAFAYFIEKGGASMKELIVAFLMWFGGGFMFIAAIGILRFPDLYIRMHAATKVGTLGISGLVLAGMLDFADTAVTTQGVLVILFFFLTAPIAAHMISRAAYNTGVNMSDHSVMDEMKNPPAA